MGICDIRIKHIILFCAFVFCAGQIHASHIMGSDISYRCTGTGQYEVIVKLYRDCSGFPAPASITIDVSSTCDSRIVSLSMDNPNSGIEVSQLCPSAISTCAGGPYPGVEVYTYTGLV